MSWLLEKDQMTWRSIVAAADVGQVQDWLEIMIEIAEDVFGAAHCGKCGFFW